MIKLPNGQIQNGQYSKLMARDNRMKTFREPALAHGMKRVTTGDVHPWLHGQAADDRTREKDFKASNVPTHPGMVTTPHESDRLRGVHNPQEGNAVFADAAKLGNPKSN
jgi:hypothetical protein